MWAFEANVKRDAAFGEHMVWIPGSVPLRCTAPEM
jgi:hypothetical protein